MVAAGSNPGSLGRGGQCVHRDLGLHQTAVCGDVRGYPRATGLVTAGKIIENWAPVTAWIEKWAQKFQDAIAPIKAFFNGGFGELIADAKARVDVFTQAQLKTNAEGKGELAPVFFKGTVESSPSPLAAPGTTPEKPALQAGSLSQTSNTLIQQSAANNRTQLEGGLTVRFENAPAGLRTDQPQTNQPGPGAVVAHRLSLTVGRRFQ